MKLTPAQKKVITRFEEIGGIGWMGTALVDGKRSLTEWARNVRGAFGKKEYDRVNRLRKRLGVTSAGVYCSGVTMFRMRELGLIEPVLAIPGVWRLTADYKEKIEAT